MANKVMTLVIMGVSGTGKSTIGQLLSVQLNIPFFDGDDYHPEANVQKMSEGIPLNDMDRKGWLARLNQLALEHKNQGAIIACSALKESYRVQLQQGLDGKMVFVYLEGTFELIKSRLESRKGHFMTAKLLQSQFDTLEVPSKAISVSIALSPEEIVAQVMHQLGHEYLA